MKKAKGRTRVIYIPGNHDEMFRQLSGLNFGGFAIRRSAIHVIADGRRLLVLHGDEFGALSGDEQMAKFKARARHKLGQ